MSELKPIMVRYFDPNNSFFKSKSNDRYSYTVYSCNNCEKCEAYQRGKCVLINGLWGDPCPYGKKNHIEGMTKKSKTGYKLLTNAREEYKECEGKHFDTLDYTCQIGDYIYLNLAYLGNYSNPIDKQLDILYEHFLPLKNWNVDTIMTLTNYHPEALFGGVIKEYQQKYVPSFLQSLKRYFPDMYKQVIEKKPELDDKIKNIDYVWQKSKSFHP